MSQFNNLYNSIRFEDNNDNINNSNEKMIYNNSKEIDNEDVILDLPSSQEEDDNDNDKDINKIIEEN